MHNDPLNLDSVAFECLGYSLASNTGVAFLEGLGKLKKAYEGIEHPQKNVREVANNSSVILDLQTSSIILDLTPTAIHISALETFRKGLQGLLSRGEYAP